MKSILYKIVSCDRHQANGERKKSSTIRMNFFITFTHSIEFI